MADLLRVRFFIRVDDYFDPSSHERAALEWLLENDYRLHIAVIPGLLTTDGARYLRTIFTAYSSKIEVGQHGYLHTCRQLGQKRFEVGPGMSRREQAQVISRGRISLSDKLQMPITEVFTPPFNGYDANTILALRDTGFKILSAAQRSILPETKHLRHVHVNMDVCARYFPRPALLPIKRIKTETECVGRRDGFVGVMLHPNLTRLTPSWLSEWSSMMGAMGLSRSVLLSDMTYC